jgi:hypothetical protein
MIRTLLALALVLTAGLFAGCDQQATQPSDPASAPLATSSAIPSAESTSGGAVDYAPRFDPDGFVRDVDNRFFPLVPGTRWVYRGVEDGEEETNVTIVTHDRKTILGISATVVFDRVFVHGELKEKTFDWYAQDTRGNVWYLGEDTKEYEDGKVVSTEGSWQAGVHGAEPGIIMPAHPQIGQRYRQEFLAGEAEDMARVTGVDMDITLHYGSFHNCIRTVEWTRLEPGVKESKIYCPRVGFVGARGVEGPETRLVLKNITSSPR